MARRPRLLWLGAYALLLAAPLVAVGGYQRLAPDPAAAFAGPHVRPFDAGSWARGDRTLRYEQVSDLLDRHDFRGQTRDHVERLLGPAQDHRDGFSIRAGEAYGGSLGDESSAASRTFELVFRTDAAGRVVGVEFVCSGWC